MVVCTDNRMIQKDPDMVFKFKTCSDNLCLSKAHFFDFLLMALERAYVCFLKIACLFFYSLLN